MRTLVLEARLGKVEEVLRRWDDSWKRIEEASELIHRNTRRLNECMDALAMKVDIADFAQMKAEIAAEMDRQYTEMNLSKASSQSLNSLEDSQHRILEEVVALQQLIACKVRAGVRVIRLLRCWRLREKPTTLISDEMNETLSNLDASFFTVFFLFRMYISPL